jgi:hypothetical protein
MYNNAIERNARFLCSFGAFEQKSGAAFGTSAGKIQKPPRLQGRAGE